ncbi:MAG: hypothetical protein ACI910_000213 [Oleispira sp.]|jgi:hypothetical protein
MLIGLFFGSSTKNIMTGNWAIEEKSILALIGKNREGAHKKAADLSIAASLRQCQGG